MSLQIRADKLLLVEGRDEVNLFEALIAQCLDDEVEIHVIDAGGVDQFPRRLAAIRTAARAHPTLRSIGVVRDADDDAYGAFKSVCGHLHDVGYLPPAAHGEFSDATPSIGVFVVPDGSSTGALETLVGVPWAVRTPPDVSTSTSGVWNATTPCSRGTPTRASHMPISLRCAILSRGSVKEREVACGTWSRQHSQHSLDFFATSPRRVPDRARTLPASWSFVCREEELRARNNLAMIGHPSMANRP